MHSGSMLKQLPDLDRWFGAHQKIDRLAWRYASELDPALASDFPGIREILRFEGRDGPDGIKLKTPGEGEPWHFYNPNDETDTDLLRIIEHHHKKLVGAIRESNITRASFEAAWLAHAVVDGLTPAHQYPYEQELERLRGGQGKETRDSPKGKLLVPGETKRQQVKNNWRMWGDKGLLSTHLAYEMGVALIIMPLRYERIRRVFSRSLAPTQGKGYLGYFQAQAARVAELDLYEQFYRSGWTPTVARRTRKELVPVLVETVAALWVSALRASEKKQ